MGEPATILIIDDDPQVRGAFRRMLERGGLRTRQAEDGFEGLAAFRADRPDGVLLDLRMPRMDGLEVLSTLVAEAPEVPVIVSSGEGTMRDAVEALRRGAWDFVTKPVSDPEILVHSIERALEKSTLRRQNSEYRSHLENTNRVLAEALGELRADQQGARVLQMQLLPRDGLALGPYSAHRRLFPSRMLSGDFVDYFLVGPRHAAFYVADVSGHGAASAFVTAILTTLVAKYRQAHAQTGDATVLDPPELLARLDRDLTALSLSQHVTAFYGVIDLGAERVRYANAGHFPFPLLHDGSSASALECPGRPLGLVGRTGFSGGERAFPRNGRLLATTDGVLELGAEGSNREKREALQALFQRSASMDEICGGLGLVEGASLRDDVALLFLRGEAFHV
jgi:sigma-B regulation protein RsbU (phosphoserine phosphatase)